MFQGPTVKSEKPFKLVILKNGTDEDHQYWIRSCHKRKQDVVFSVVDLSGAGWMEKVISQQADCFLAKSPGTVFSRKQMYDERIYIISRVLNLRVYPSLPELLIYENKRLLHYWLQSNRIPHPRTWIFYNQDEAHGFLKRCEFPIVAKTIIGASGSGVKIFRNKNEAVHYVDSAFSGKGITRKWGINIRKGDLLKRSAARLKNLPEFVRYMKHKKEAAIGEPQRGYVILQKYIPCDFEWRCVRIGDSYFGHKKLSAFGEMKSGTSRVSWDPPPDALLNFVKEVTDRGGFLSQAVDIFPGPKGHYLVNELQAFWGSKNPHQMIIDGKPGRYLYKNGQWVFQEGEFNTNNSYDLRLSHVIDMIKGTLK